MSCRVLATAPSSCRRFSLFTCQNKRQAERVLFVAVSSPSTPVSGLLASRDFVSIPIRGPTGGLILCQNPTTLPGSGLLIIKGQFLISGDRPGLLVHPAGGDPALEPGVDEASVDLVGKALVKMAGARIEGMFGESSR